MIRVALSGYERKKSVWSLCQEISDHESLRKGHQCVLLLSWGIFYVKYHKIARPLSVYWKRFQSDGPRYSVFLSQALCKFPFRIYCLCYWLLRFGNILFLSTATVSLVPCPFWGVGYKGSCIGARVLGVEVHRGLRYPPPRYPTPRKTTSLEGPGYGWQAGGTHPTGMLSC